MATVTEHVVSEALKARLANIEKEAIALRRALVALDGSTTGKRRVKRRRAVRRRSGERAKRGERQRQFLATAEANPKATIAEIARQIGISTTQAAGLAHRLEARGELKRSRQGLRVLQKTAG